MTDSALDTGMPYAFAAPAEARWSPRRTLLFIVAASLTLWGAIILAAVQLS